MTVSTKQFITDALSLPNLPQVLKEISAIYKEELKKREEFYNHIAEYEKAEFINGEIIIHSPVKKEHNDVLGLLSRLVSSYVDRNHLGYVGIEKVMVRLTRNDFEPDLCYFKAKKASSFKEGQSLFPPPDFVVEVLSKKTGKNDREIKFIDYQGHGVEEYWMIDPIQKVVEQYRLNLEGEYELIIKSNSGAIACNAIKGFKINIESIFDASKNLEELTRILT